MVFHARKLTLWLTLIGSLCVAALGYVMRQGLPLHGTLGCVLMLACAGMAAMALYQGRPALHLRTDGFVLYAVWSTLTVRWSQIERIETIYIRGHAMGCIHYHAIVPGGHGATRLKRCVLSNVYDAPLPGIQATLLAWQRMYGKPR